MQRHPKISIFAVKLLSFDQSLTFWPNLTRFDQLWPFQCALRWWHVVAPSLSQIRVSHMLVVAPTTLLPTRMKLWWSSMVCEALLFEQVHFLLRRRFCTSCLCVLHWQLTRAGFWWSSGVMVSGPVLAFTVAASFRCIWWLLVLRFPTGMKLCVVREDLIRCGCSRDCISGSDARWFVAFGEDVETVL